MEALDLSWSVISADLGPGAMALSRHLNQNRAFHPILDF
jgi:hypothetical protein